jgi:putative ABC transport system permease protein
MALGAQRSQIGASVVKSGVRVVSAGVALGILIAIALGRLLDSQLYGTSSRDPVVLGAVGVMLLGVAAVAAAVPAWRATRVDPVRALRAE